MAQKTVTICDRCGKEKGKENHWFAVKIQEVRANNAHSIHIEPAIFDMIPAGPERKDLCGEQCVTETVQEWLNLIQNQKRISSLAPTT